MTDNSVSPERAVALLLANYPAGLTRGQIAEKMSAFYGCEEVENAIDKQLFAGVLLYREPRKEERSPIVLQLV